MTELEQIKEREAAAASGPWWWATPGILIGPYGTVLIATLRAGDLPSSSVTVRVDKADADFIAHARQDVRYLLAYIERLEGGNSGPTEGDDHRQR